MTMLIAGHETTAAVLTWCLFCLVQDPRLLSEVRAEIDDVMGPVREEARAPTYEEIQKLELTRLCLAEWASTLCDGRPRCIRRCLEDVPLPRGAGDADITLIKGMDVFISVWNLHRSPECWEEPLKFDPKRFKRPFQNPGVKDWAGYDPELISGLYPNEVTSDFAFVPFGAGARKCIGDQFAMLEATSCLAMTLQRYEFELDKKPEEVGMEMGAATASRAGGCPCESGEERSSGRERNEGEGRRPDERARGRARTSAGSSASEKVLECSIPLTRSFPARARRF